MIERLSFDKAEAYSSLEAAIHLCRYSLAQSLCTGKRVLDISCGEGYGCSLLATKWGAAEVHGVDISDAAIARATETFADPRITFHCHAADDIESVFAAASFDLIVCLETMEHVPDARRLLTSLRRLLKPGGALLLSCPNDWWYYPEQGQGNPYHLRKFTHAEFLELTREVLGDPSQLLLGVPTGGFANVALDSPLLGGGADMVSGMFRVQPLRDAVVLPGDSGIAPKNCSYFAGLWGAKVPAAMFTVFPCSMDRSALGSEHLAGSQRGEIARLERALRDTQLLAQAWRAECEYMRSVAFELRAAPPPGAPRGPKAIAYAIYRRLRRLLGRT